MQMMEAGPRPLRELRSRHCWFLQTGALLP